jgi:Mg2+ and Co2+ transporter CorA
MLSDRLTLAISRLDIDSAQSMGVFRHSMRQTLETFLRFTHRYWFHEVSDQTRARELFRMWTVHLGSDRLYAEVREEIQDMNQYLETDSMRRQANTVVRLTVVTTFGLIGTVATGFLGMNLIAAAEQPLALKFAYFVLVMIPVTALTFYSIAKSARLSDFLEVLSDERAPARAKLDALAAVWRPRSANSD